MIPQALGQHIFVLKDARKPCMEKGILIPESLERTPRYGPSVLATVVSVGAKVKNLRPGDHIVMKDVAGDDIEFDGKQYTRLREKDIVGLAEGYA
jgi:co-chaperonin GroES (HSP10)